MVVQRSAKYSILRITKIIGFGSKCDWIQAQGKSYFPVSFILSLNSIDTFRRVILTSAGNLEFPAPNYFNACTGSLASVQLSFDDGYSCTEESCWITHTNSGGSKVQFNSTPSLYSRPDAPSSIFVRLSAQEIGSTYKEEKVVW